MWLINLIKAYGAKHLIQSLDELEPYLAGKIREAQSRLGSISPDEFSKILVDEIQVKLCLRFGINPKDIGL